MITLKYPTFSVLTGAPVKLQVVPRGAKQVSAGVFYFQSLFYKLWCLLVKSFQLFWSIDPPADWQHLLFLPFCFFMFITVSHSCVVEEVWEAAKCGEQQSQPRVGMRSLQGLRRHWAALQVTHPVEPKDGSTDPATGLQESRVAYTPGFWFLFADCFVVLLFKKLSCFFHSKEIMVASSR